MNTQTILSLTSLFILTIADSFAMEKVAQPAESLENIPGAVGTMAEALVSTRDLLNFSCTSHSINAFCQNAMKKLYARNNNIPYEDNNIPALTKLVKYHLETPLTIAYIKGPGWCFLNLGNKFSYDYHEDEKQFHMTVCGDDTFVLDARRPMNRNVVSHTINGVDQMPLHKQKRLDDATKKYTEELERTKELELSKRLFHSTKSGDVYFVPVNQIKLWMKFGFNSNNKGYSFQIGEKQFFLNITEQLYGESEKEYTSDLSSLDSFVCFYCDQQDGFRGYRYFDRQGNGCRYESSPYQTITFRVRESKDVS